MVILAGAGPRPYVRKTATVTHLYRNEQNAFDFGQPGALNPVTVAYLSRKRHDALDFARPGVHNSIAVSHNYTEICIMLVGLGKS